MSPDPHFRMRANKLFQNWESYHKHRVSRHNAHDISSVTYLEHHNLRVTIQCRIITSRNIWAVATTGRCEMSLTREMPVFEVFFDDTIFINLEIPLHVFNLTFWGVSSLLIDLIEQQEGSVLKIYLWLPLVTSKSQSGQCMQWCQPSSFKWCQASSYFGYLRYVVATISRLLKIIGLFCQRDLWKRL